MCEASRPTFRIHISGAHRGAQKNHLFRPLAAFLFLFLVRCPYSPYDLVRILREIVYFRATPRNLRAKILYMPRKNIPLRANCVYGMWASCFTHTSTRSLHEGSSRYEHCIVHPEFHLQIDLLPSISRGLLRLISSDWRYEDNKTLKNEGF